MTNPYDPPPTEITQPVMARERSFFTGGFGLVAVLALAIGGGVGALISSSFAEGPSSALFVWGAPALGWFFALAMLIGLVRNSRFSVEGAIVLLVVMVVPAYILYLPVCTVTSMLTQSYIPSGNYGPAPQGVVFGSAFAFLVILLSMAAILRVCCRVPNATVTPVPGKADDQPPENEFS